MKNKYISAFSEPKSHWNLYSVSPDRENLILDHYISGYDKSRIIKFDANRWGAGRTVEMTITTQFSFEHIMNTWGAEKVMKMIQAEQQETRDRKKRNRNIVRIQAYVEGLKHEDV